LNISNIANTVLYVITKERLRGPVYVDGAQRSAI